LLIVTQLLLLICSQKEKKEKDLIPITVSRPQGSSSFTSSQGSSSSTSLRTTLETQLRLAKANIHCTALEKMKFAVYTFAQFISAYPTFLAKGCV
jgi:hypothetical protein